MIHAEMLKGKYILGVGTLGLHTVQVNAFACVRLLIMCPEPGTALNITSALNHFILTIPTWGALMVPTLW